MKTGKKPKVIIYPCRIPREMFERVQRIAEERDLKISQIVRAALRQALAVRQEDAHDESARAEP